MVFNSFHFVVFFSSSTRCTGAAAPGAELAAARRELLLLRVVGLAVSRSADRPRRSSTISCAHVHRPRRPHRRRQRSALVLSLVFNLAMLGFFKYFNFFADSLHALFGALGLQARLRHAAHRAADRHLVLHVHDDELRDRRVPARDRAAAEPASTSRCSSPTSRTWSPARFCARRCCCRRSRGRASIAREQIRDGLWLIAWGFFKKIFVADNLAPLADAVFDPAASPTGARRAARHLCLRVSDLRRLLGLLGHRARHLALMGIELNVNFRFPYFVRIAAEFWRHWHISLSTWLRDYLYIPLGGNRGTDRAARTQSADHDGARRPVARRRVDVRALGHLSGRALMAFRIGRGWLERRPARWLDEPWARPLVSAHVPADLLWMADLPGELGGADRDHDGEPGQRPIHHDGKDRVVSSAAAVLRRSADASARLRGASR